MSKNMHAQIYAYLFTCLQKYIAMVIVALSLTQFFFNEVFPISNNDKQIWIM